MGRGPCVSGGGLLEGKIFFVDERALTESTTARSIAFSSARTLPGHRYARIFARALSVEALDGLVVLQGEALHEVVREDHHVPATQAQGRHLDVHDVQPVVQVLPEASGLDVGGEVAVGRRDDADVHTFTAAAAADTLERPLLQHLKQLHLGQDGILADLVEEQRPPSACSKRPRRRWSAPVNDPFSCPNSSLSRSDSASAAQWRETKGFSRAGSARGPRERCSPSRSALLGEKDRRPRASDPARRPAHPLHCRARANQPLQALAVAIACLTPQVLRFDPQLAPFERARSSATRSASKSTGLVT